VHRGGSWTGRRRRDRQPPDGVAPVAVRRRRRPAGPPAGGDGTGRRTDQPQLQGGHTGRRVTSCGSPDRHRGPGHRPERRVPQLGHRRRDGGRRPGARLRADQSALVIGFIEGRTFDDGDFGRPGGPRPGGASCRQLHDGPRFVNDFDMFEIQAGSCGRPRARLPLPTTPGAPPGRGAHPGALGPRTERRWPATTTCWPATSSTTATRAHHDYEYSGNNDACFELGNIWSECHLTLDQLEHLVTAYYGRRLATRWPGPGSRA